MSNMETRVCGICNKPIGPQDKVKTQQLDDGMGLPLMFHQDCVDAFQQVLIQEQELEPVPNPAPTPMKKATVASKQCSLCGKPTTNANGAHTACLEQAYPYGRPRL